LSACTTWGDMPDRIMTAFKEPDVNPVSPLSAANASISGREAERAMRATAIGLILPDFT